MGAAKLKVLMVSNETHYYIFKMILESLGKYSSVDKYLKEKLDIPETIGEINQL